MLQEPEDEEITKRICGMKPSETDAARVESQGECMSDALNPVIFGWLTMFGWLKVCCRGDVLMMCHCVAQGNAWCYRQSSDCKTSAFLFL